MRVLVFSASVGSGHNQVAKALAEEVNDRYRNSTIEVLDVIQTVSPFLNKIILESYLRMLRHAPTVWSLIYDQAMKTSISDSDKLMNRLLARELRKTVQSFNPDVIVCTHAFSSTLMGILKARGDIECPVVTIITDYTVHALWLHYGIDRFYIAAKELASALAYHNIDPRKIKTTGIPVRRQFIDVAQKSTKRIKHKLSLGDKRTIMFMGGGLGLGDIMQVLSSVDQVLTNTQILVICGSNTQLQHQIHQEDHKNNVYTFGFMENISEFMIASDLIVSKPGGVTSTEVFCLRKPLAMISPIPGQETGNRNFFLNHGVAISIPTNPFAGHIIKDFLDSPLRVKCLEQLTTTVCNPGAASQIVTDIELLAKT